MCEKIDFDSEYALQHLTNERLKKLFGYDYITHEFQFKGFKINGLEINDKKESLRIDGLAFDEEQNAFVIIEYKNSLSEKVFEQGKNYYYNLIETFDGHFKKDSKSKEEIEKLETDYYKQVQANQKELKKRYNKVLEGDDCFKNAKVLIIGPEFNDIQEISEAPNYPHEIYKVSLYKKDEINGYALYERVDIDSEKSDESDEKKINVNLGNLKLTKCTLLCNKTDEIKKLYNNFEWCLLNHCDDLDIKYMVDFVSIKAHKKFICRVDVKNSIKIHYYIDKEEFKDEILTQENIENVICSIKKVYRQKVRE